MTPVRRAAVASILLVAALVGADTGTWFWVTGSMLAAVQEWTAGALEQGLRVQSAPPVRAGWPFAAEILLPAVTADAGLATWQAGLIRLSLSPLHPATLAVAVNGVQSLRLGGWPPIRIVARALGATVPLGAPDGVAAEGRGITAALGEGTLSIGVLAARLDGSGLDVTAAQLVIPGEGLPFGGAIERLTAHAHATVPLPLRPGGAGPLNPADAAAAWARAPGAIVVDDATLSWGALDAQGSGRISLDGDLQPVAEGHLRLNGYHDAIDALARAGTISRAAARVAATVLDMMSTSRPGDTPAVDAPLTLRHGAVSMGAIPLARLPPITWP